MVEHDIGVECAILETKELVCGRLAVFISNRRRSPDIKYGCVSMLPLCGDVSGVSNSDMVRPYGTYVWLMSSAEAWLRLAKIRYCGVMSGAMSLSYGALTIQYRPSMGVAA